MDKTESKYTNDEKARWFDENFQSGITSAEKSRQSRQKIAWRTEKIKAWASARGLKEVQKGCIGKVLDGPRHRCQNNRGYYCDKYPDYDELNIRWIDHVVMFKGSAGYVFTTQPYGMTPEIIEQLRKDLDNLGLKVEVSSEDAWWYPGVTLLIIISKK